MTELSFIEVSGDTLSIVAKSFNRTVESLNEDVATLKQWMKNQPHLPEILDDKSIQNFLLMNKCSIERAKSRIDMYYTLRNQVPSVFENINPKVPVMRKTMEITQWVPLPKLTKENYRVLLWRVRIEKLIEEVDPFDTIKVMCNMQEIRLKEDVMCGDILIIDMGGVTFRQAAKLTPTFVSTFLTIYEKIYSIRLKGVYLVNSPSFVKNILTIAKAIMKPKLFERIRVSEDISILHENLPKELLPTEYGGDGISTEQIQELQNLKLAEYQNRFDQLDKLRVNEDLRPEKLKNDDILGFHGNFKKLSVD